LAKCYEAHSPDAISTPLEPVPFRATTPKVEKKYWYYKKSTVVGEEGVTYMGRTRSWKKSCGGFVFDRARKKKPLAGWVMLTKKIIKIKMIEN